MPAPDPFANLSPGITAAVPPRNERRRSAQPGAWKLWLWPILGLLGGLMTAAGTRLPMATLPLIGAVTYAEDNGARAWGVLGCAVLAGVCCAVRWFRPSLMGNGAVLGLLTASALEKYKDLRELKESTHVPPGAGDMVRQGAAATAKLLEGVHLDVGVYLLAVGCLLGIVAGLAGRRG